VQHSRTPVAMRAVITVGNLLVAFELLTVAMQWRELL
jgi:hypothetical protein